MQRRKQHSQKRRKTGWLYCRKSLTPKGMSEDEAVGYQRVACVDYASRYDIDITNEFYDVGWSGANTHRPDLQKLLAQIKVEKPDVLLIYSVDRLGRDLRENIMLFLEIIEHVKEVVFVSQGLSNDSESFKMMFIMLCAMAEETRMNIKNQLTLGRTNKVINRKMFIGKTVPLGYTKDKHGRLRAATFANTSDLKEQNGLKIFEFIVYSFLLGYSLRSIAKELNKRFGSSRRGRRWSHKAVEYVLKNPIYTGCLVGKLEQEHYMVDNAEVDVLLDKLMYEFIQQMLKYEQSGRKKANTILNRRQAFTLCKNCWRMPEEDQQGYLVCPACKHRTLKSEIGKAINQAMINAFQDHIDRFNVNAFISELQMRYKTVLCDLKSNIDDLLERKEIIMDWGNSESIQKLIESNTQLITEKQRDYQLTEHILDFLHKADNTEFNNLIRQNVRNHLIKLPYLVLIDLTGNQVFLVYHNNIFYGGEQQLLKPKSAM